MVKKVLSVMALCSFAIIAFSQSTVLLAGFPEKNFKSELKANERYAKANGIEVSEIPEMFNKLLLSGVQVNNDINFVQDGSVTLPDFEQCNYTTKGGTEDGDFIVLKEVCKPEEIKEAMTKNGADYFMHFTGYHIYKDLTKTKKKTGEEKERKARKKTHRVDYQVFNKNMEVIMEGSQFLRGSFSGSALPENFAAKYEILSSKIGKKFLQVTGQAE